MVKIIYNCRDIVLAETDKLFAVCSGFQGTDAEGKVIGINVTYHKNPVLAFDHWINLVDASGRRSIGEYLREQGRNPYTGELNQEHIMERVNSCIKKDC